MQTFIDELYAADREQEFKGAMLTAAQALDLPHFVYLGISKRAMDSPLVITTYPGAWEHRYLDRAYRRIDPVVMRAFSSHAPFHWGTHDTLAGLSKKQLRIFDEAAMFGLRCGLTVPIHDDFGRMSAVTFASRCSMETRCRTTPAFGRAAGSASTPVRIRPRRPEACRKGFASCAAA